MAANVYYSGPGQIDVAASIDTLDEETVDEMLYDEQNASLFLDRVSAATIQHPLFHIVYDLAAAKMISVDREIGIAVLMSYDYLAYFYPCLVEFTHSPETFTETSTTYQLLLRSIQ